MRPDALSPDEREIEHDMQSESSQHMTQTAVLVLGAGRSGTSTLSRGLAALGINIGQHFVRPVRKNPRGLFEEKHLLALSKKVRNSLGMRADSVQRIDDERWNNPATQRLSERMQRAIRRWYGDAPIWAFKYAGTGRLLPFWLTLFERMEIEPAFVFAYRNPLSVRASRAKLNQERAVPAHNQLEWLANVLPHIHRLENRRLIVVDYDRLLEQPEQQLLRVAEKLGIAHTPEMGTAIQDFARQFLRRDLRHTHFGDEDLKNDHELHPLVRKSALLLSSMARDAPLTDEPELWAHWRALQTEYFELGPILALIEDLKRANRRARWWDLSQPLRTVWNKMPVLRVK